MNRKLCATASARTLPNLQERTDRVPDRAPLISRGLQTFPAYTPKLTAPTSSSQVPLFTVFTGLHNSQVSAFTIFTPKIFSRFNRRSPFRRRPRNRNVAFPNISTCNDHSRPLNHPVSIAISVGGARLLLPSSLCHRPGPRSITHLSQVPDFFAFLR